MSEGRPDTYAELRLAEGKLLGWDERETTSPCAVQPRDAEILTALARYRFLTTSQIAELWWPDSGMRAVRRRLAQLFEAGLVERFRPQTIRGAFQWTYCLARDGFRAAEQSGELPDGLKFTPRRERLFDYRYVIHDLRVNEWVIRFRELAGENLLDWAGPDESRIEPPRDLPASIQDTDHEWTTLGLDRRAVRPIQPDARLEVVHTKGDRMMYVEYDRTRRVDKNYDKFRRYEAFISWWWQWTPLTEWLRPAVVFICQDEDHRLRFLDAADAEFRVCRSRWTRSSDREESVREELYLARHNILFALEEDIREGRLDALRVPPWPRGHEKRDDRASPRTIRLPGLPAED